MVRQVCKLPACTVVRALRQSRVKSCSAREDCECFCFAFAFACVVGINPKTPKLSPMADDARGGIGSLVSLVYICILYTYIGAGRLQLLGDHTSKCAKVFLHIFLT